MMAGDTIELWAPSLAVVAALLCLYWFPPRDDMHPASQICRASAALLTGSMVLRYVCWRVGVLPVGLNELQLAWAVIFMGVEMFNHLSNLLALFFLSRTRNRSREADAAQYSPLVSAPTDVLIPTYNEPRAVLERTIVGALDIDHPDLRVWVLDDGARPWVRELAESLGANYLFRIKGKHAKAGNVNNGLRHVLSHGRRPQFILVLDADFIASRQILRRTLGLFETPNVGVVQTPQHFFNPDPVQTNLACTHVWPDEQRFFFNVLMPSKDAWGAAFCCGTSAVMRVEALEATGGLATETVTEDMLTSFKMREHGWQTIYLNERLSLGLAPEGLGEYVVQRGRWCLGGVQQLRTRWGPFGRGRIGLINRISSFDSGIYWMFSFLFKVMLLACPAVYWLTGTPVIAATGEELIYWLMPSVLASILFMSIYGKNLIIPVMTDISQLLSATVVITNVVISLFRPWGRPFKVTDKGVSRDRVVIQWHFMWPFLVISAATILGLALNASPYSELAGNDGYSVSVFWSVFNVVLMGLVCLTCIELPRRRAEERFETSERCVVIWPGSAGTECQLRDISLGGARLVAERWDRKDQTGILALNEGRVRVPFEVLRQSGPELVVRFQEVPESRKALIGRLFGGDYVKEMHHVIMHRVLGTLMRRLLG